MQKRERGYRAKQARNGKFPLFDGFGKIRRESFDLHLFGRTQESLPEEMP
jgi:hypothetical protein